MSFPTTPPCSSQDQQLQSEIKVQDFSSRLATGKQRPIKANSHYSNLETLMEVYKRKIKKQCKQTMFLLNISLGITMDQKFPNVTKSYTCKESFPAKSVFF